MLVNGPDGSGGVGDVIFSDVDVFNLSLANKLEPFRAVYACACPLLSDLSFYCVVALHVKNISPEAAGCAKSFFENSFQYSECFGCGEESHIFYGVCVILV